MSQTTIGVRIDEETQHRLKKMAALRDRTPHYLMKEAVAKYLDEAEEIEVEKALMNSRWEEFSLTGEIISHQDMRDWAANLPRKK